MVRGFVYSCLAIIAFLLAGIGWMSMHAMGEDALVLLGGWLLLISLFAVGPLFFAIGYWHHLRLNPAQPRWDAELGE